VASRRVLSRALVLSMSAALASLQVLSGVPVIAPTPVARAADPVYPTFSGGFFGSQAAAAPAGIANLAETPTVFGQPGNPTPATVTATGGGAPLQGASILRSDLSGSSLASTTLVSLHLERLPIAIPLSTIPMHRASAPATWDALLASTPLAGLPQQNVTWKQVFDLASRPAVVDAITMADVDWSGSVLADLPLAAFTFGGQDITTIAIPLQPGEPLTDTTTAQRWCYVLNVAKAGSCATPAALNGQTLIGISIGGAPLKNIPLKNIPLKNIDLSSSPLKNIPLKNIVLQVSPLKNIPLKNIDVAASPLKNIPLKNILLDGAGVPTASPLKNIPLKNIAWAFSPLKNIPLKNIDLSASPLKNIPLKNIDFSAAPLGTIPLKNIDLTASPLKNIPLKNIDFAVAPLKNIPLKNIDLTASPLKNIPLKNIAATAAPLKNIPLKNIDFSAAPLKNIPLKNINLSASGLDALPLGTIAWASAALGTASLDQLSFAGGPLASIAIVSTANPAAVAGCVATSSCPATELTLADAQAASDILPGATLADIGAGFAGHGTLADLLAARITGSTIDPNLGDLRLDLAGSPAPTVTIGALLGALSASQPDPVVADISAGSVSLGDLGLDVLAGGPAMTLNDLLTELKPGSPDVLLGDLRLDLLSVADTTTVGALLALLVPGTTDVKLGDLSLDTATGVDALVLNAITGFLLDPTDLAGYLLGALGTYTDATGHDITLGELGLWTDGTGADITLGDLAKYLDDSVSLADVLLGLVPPAQFPFENFPIASLGLSDPGRSILKPSAAFMASYGSCGVEGTPIDPSLSVNLPTCRNVRFLNPGGGPTPVSSDPVAMDVILPVGASPISVTVSNQAGTLGTVPLRVTTDPDGHVRVAFTFPALAPGGLGDFFISFDNGLQLGPQSMTTEMRSPTGDLVASEVEGNPNVVDASEPNAPVEDPAFSSGDPLRNVPVNSGGCSSLPATCAGTDPTYVDDLVTGYISYRNDVDWYQLPNVRAGSRISADLTNLPLDADLVLYGPSSIPTPPTLFPASTVGLPGTLVEDPGLGVGRAADSIAAQALGDLQLDKGYFSPIFGPSGSQVPPLTPLSISQHPGTDPESVGAIAPVDGNYIVAVTGYNGATSTNPYLLRARVTTPAADASCPARTLVSPLPASAIPTIPSGTNTLFLTNPGRLAATYGQADATAVTAGLDHLVSYLNTTSSLGIVPAVVPLDAYPAVQTAYAAWDAHPCSVSAANSVAAQVTGVIHAIQAANPGLAYVTIVGGDDIVPMGRVPDLTRVSNEKEYAATFGDALNPISAAESASYTLTDDVFGDTSPTALGNGNDLFVPRLAVGRLVETPADILGQLAAFGPHNGTLDTGTGLVAGYDFLADGAQAVAARLAVGGRSVDSGLIDQPGAATPWTQSDLIAKLFPATGATPLVDSINAHYDHTALLPSAGNAGTSGQLETAADVAARSTAGQLLGRILFTMGCHAGLAVPDAYIAGTDAASATLKGDWAQTLSHAGASVYVANTGYGIGDTSSVAYSERLMALFSKLLDGSVTVGQALAFAKQSYYGSLGAVGVYDVKILQQAAFYGLPFWRVSTATGATPPPPPTAPALPGTIGPDPIPGLQSMPLTISPTFQPVTGSRGTYWVVGDGTSNEDPQVTQYQPILPRTSESVVTPGQTAHGALVTSLVSSDLANVNPVLDTPTVDLSASSPEVTSGDSAWPGRLATITTSQAPYGRAQSLVLVPGQFIGSTSDGTGRQRLFDHLGVSVIYAPNTTTDFTAPLILSTKGDAAGSSVAFTVSASDPDSNTQTDPIGTVARVRVGYHDFDGSWRFLDLAHQAGTTTWTGTTIASHAFAQTDGVEYFVQAVDGAGNVATAANKAAGFTARVTDLTPPTIVAAVSAGTLGANGWYVSNVVVHFTCSDAGSGIPAGTCPADEVLSGDGAAVSSTPQTVADAAGNVSAPSNVVTVAIDMTPPSASPTQAPAANGAGYTSTDTAVTWNWSDAAGGAGVDATACTTSSTTSGEGSLALTATCKDLAGNTGTASTTVKVDKTPPTIVAAVSAGTLAASGWYSSNVTVHFTCSDPGSGIPAGACPANQVLTTEGTAVSSTAQTVTDAAGNVSSPSNVVTVKIDKTPPVAVAGGPYAGLAGSPIAITGASAVDALNQASVTVAWSASSPSCQYSSTTVIAPTITCSIAGTFTATLSASDGINPPAKSTATITTTKRTSATSVTCAPSPVLPGTATTCTALVADTAPVAGSSPSGAVAWTVVTGAGAFGPTTCTTTAAGRRCVVTFTVGASQTAVQSVSATYAGDATYQGSAASGGIAVLYAAPDRYVTVKGTALVVAAPGVLGNDVPGGVAAIPGTAPSKGTLVLAPNGGFRYTPSVGFAGSVTFTYRAQAGSLLSSPATVTTWVLGSGMTCATPCDLSGFTISGFNLSGGNFTGASFAGDVAVGTSFSGACLTSANLTGINAANANFAGANLTKSVLVNANLTGANLSGANLTGANLAGANLSKANLAGANLSGANLAGANLAGASLTGANLSGANLTGGNLTGANLTGANLSTANLSNANLTGANLKGAKTTGANLTGVTWSGTTCPDGTSSSAHGNTCVGHLTPATSSLSTAGSGLLAAVGGAVDRRLG